MVISIADRNIPLGFIGNFPTCENFYKFIKYILKFKTRIPKTKSSMIRPPVGRFEQGFRKKKENVDFKWLGKKKGIYENSTF